MATTPTADPQARLVAALLESLKTTRPAPSVELIETHISYVLLAGDTVFKIKKSVNLGFVDFTTLALRRFYCEEELRLNRRLAPGLYLGVMPITGSPDRPVLDGEGLVIEWALRMRSFPQHGLWDHMAERGALGPEHVDALAASLSAFHRVAEVAEPNHPFGLPAKVREPMRDNFTALHDLCHDAGERAQLAALDAWEKQAFDALQGTFGTRLREGFVRECHGDLHLGNVTQHEGRTTMFDCLEFSAELRWTDVMSDVGFMAMDLHSHRLAHLANRFVNACTEHSGDHAGLRVLRYYMVHRALVRAKVAALRGTQGSGAARGTALHAAHHYLDVALTCSRHASPVLLLTHGFSGSGKTASTQSLLELCGGIRVRADVERKRLFDLHPLARSSDDLKARLYSPAATEATQARLREAAAHALGGGFPVILDATFLAFEHRENLRALARAMSAQFVIVDFQASHETLRERVRQRSRTGGDASEADLAVLDAQLLDAQPLRPEELAQVHVFDAEPPLDEPRMAQHWAPLLRRVGLPGWDQQDRQQEQLCGRRERGG